MKKDDKSRVQSNLSPIKQGERPKVLLLGNGINRAFSDSHIAWDELIGKMSREHHEPYEKKNFEDLPYPLKVVACTGDNVDEGLNNIAKHFMPKDISNGQQEIIKSYIDIGFDAILTTNYSYEIEKAIDSAFMCEQGKASKYRKKSFAGNKVDEDLGIYRYMELNSENGKNNIWHIHGEAAKPNSMIIGHYYYGKLLSRIQEYIQTIIKRRIGCNKYDKEYIPRNWIDYFMLGDVYIVGLGLDFSEMDLWWLINCKQRNQKKLDAGNIYWLEPNLNQDKNYGKKTLADLYGINVITEKVNGNNYRKYYKLLKNRIINQID